MGSGAARVFQRINAKALAGCEKQTAISSFVVRHTCCTYLPVVGDGYVELALGSRKIPVVEEGVSLERTFHHTTAPRGYQARQLADTYGMAPLLLPFRDFTIYLGVSWSSHNDTSTTTSGRAVMVSFPLPSHIALA